MADNNAVNGVGDAYQWSASAASRKDDQSLSMDDFFQLLVAQLQNQDMFNPTDNSQLINQMAQFSMVNALSDMQELSSVTYGMTLIGKQATVAQMVDGQMTSDTGVIQSVNLYNGGTEVVINGESYGIANVMSVADPNGDYGEGSSLVSNAGLVGMSATAMRGTDEGVETVRGVIEALRLVDNEVKAYIGGRAFSLRELTEISAAKDTAGDEPEDPEDPVNP
jgi:flagellar basal-body rod modification protein FlgD